MNNEWAFRYFETTIVHSAKRLIVQDKHILPHYRRLNYRFNKMANQYKSIFQDIIQGTYRPEKKYRDTDNTANLHLHLEIYAEQIFKKYFKQLQGVSKERILECIKDASKLFGVNPLCAEKNRFYLLAKLVHGNPKSTLYELLGQNQVPAQFAFTQNDLAYVPPCCSCSICINRNQHNSKKTNATGHKQSLFKSPQKKKPQSSESAKENQSPQRTDVLTGPYSGAGSKKSHRYRRRYRPTKRDLKKLVRDRLVYLIRIRSVNYK